MITLNFHRFVSLPTFQRRNLTNITARRDQRTRQENGSPSSIVTSSHLINRLVDFRDDRFSLAVEGEENGPGVPINILTAVPVKQPEVSIVVLLFIVIRLAAPSYESNNILM